MPALKVSLVTRGALIADHRGVFHVRDVAVGVAEVGDTHRGALRDLGIDFELRTPVVGIEVAQVLGGVCRQEHEEVAVVRARAGTR